MPTLKRKRSRAKRAAALPPPPKATKGVAAIASRIAKTLPFSANVRAAATASISRGIARRQQRSRQRRVGFGSAKDPSISAHKKRRIAFDAGTAAVTNVLVSIAQGSAATALTAAARAVSATLKVRAKAGSGDDDDASDNDYSADPDADDSSANDNDDDDDDDDDDDTSAAVVRTKLLTPFGRGKTATS